MGLKFFGQMTMSHPAVDTSGEHELVAIANELERYWSEQWRRAKDICDLLEQRLATRTPARPQLTLVSDGTATVPRTGDGEPARPLLRVVEP
jgi:hypothetical protein